MPKHLEKTSVLLLVFSILSSNDFVGAELENSHKEEPNIIAAPKKVVIRKCCKENEILVELDVGLRTCKLRSDYIKGMKGSYKVFGTSNHMFYYYFNCISTVISFNKYVFYF